MLFGDYHTHTTYSHGKTSIEQNVQVAESLGIKEIAITDHGFGHIAMGMKRRDVKKMKREIADCNEKYSVKTLFGVESNIISRDGDVDFRKDEIGIFDVILCGYHKGVWGKTWNEFWKFIAKNNYMNMFRETRCADFIAEYTKVYIEVIKKNPIDVITHLNHDIYVDPVEVAKCARDYGTIIELNSKRQHFTDEQLLKVADTGVDFIISSDAHHSRRIGDVDLAMTQVKRVGLDLKRIVNIDRFPIFRSKA
ncbi:MAG: PHP domain-containing protein [Bacillota bacterium]